MSLSRKQSRKDTPKTFNMTWVDFVRSQNHAKELGISHSEFIYMAVKECMARIENEFSQTAQPSDSPNPQQICNKPNGLLTTQQLTDAVSAAVAATLNHLNKKYP
jgi:hypothetical protein